MLLALHLLQRPTETQLNQHTTNRPLSNRRAITEDMPEAVQGGGEIRLPDGVARPAWGRGGTAGAWLPSKAILSQPGAARQPMPQPGCVQDFALKWSQNGAKDAEPRSGCES